MLRDAVTNMASFMEAAAKNPRYAGKSEDEIPKPFSLSRVQLAVWTTIISCCYIYLALCGACTLEINSTALILMGISAGTTTLASTIDKSQETQLRHQNEPSKGFLMDIMCDNNGISVHRFQNIVWTVIAIATYLCYIELSVCKLPDLDGTLIAMTGISSSAYLGLKINENGKG
ncbi:MAG: hypothetical protein A3H98_10475 [Bacteroidetes bacterium RIFCSPLOWO2_02_FULL_36_8]|nr:MAG: hypothetical protein A3H98_10475 [Bacteroidetes bacterium RIFCSPLOWO2_02_FULL_36_8]OFY70935.1 MAG: hypothetical protein A3G23_12515 [Bacteroidetes bacterium RIFCSPLOWO2_12_FULL_37_12]